MHLLPSKLKVLFRHLKKKSIAIKTKVKLLCLLPSILGKIKTSTRPMQIYMDDGVSLLCFKYCFRARSLVVSDLRPETPGSRFYSGC